ncbi:MAG: hypothetical protein DWQ36_12815 [Acidobacteria bacterium]|nr:MAG: hypothetical protein DWQ36_12815 [Acidobacteriota bacterium]
MVKAGPGPESARPPLASGAPADAAREPRAPAWVVWVTAAILLAPMLGAIAGQRTLFFRDVSNLHLPAKWSQAQSWQQGAIPVLDLLRAGGQPSLGNPNLLPLYPDNLLYLIAPFLWAFNAHYWLHLLLAPFAAAWLGRTLGMARLEAWAMGLFYAASGWFFSQLNFYNLVAVSALLPALLAAALLAARHGGRRRAARLALVFGLLLLAGDPLLALLGVIAAAVLVALEGVPPRRLLTLAGALAVGFLIGLAQHLEFARILGSSYRSYVGYSSQGSLVGSWDPRQVLEWLVPFAYGRPDQTFWGARFFGGVQPFFFSLYPGVLLLAGVLASGVPRDRTRRAAWVAVGAGLFLALGAHNPAVVWLSEISRDGVGALLRFPAKAWWLVALGVAYLAARGLARLAASRRLALQVLGLLAGLHLVLLAALAGPWAAGWIAGLGPLTSPERVAEVLEQWRRGLSWGASAALALLVLSLLGRRWGAGRWMAAALCVHALVQVVVLAPLHATDEVAAFARPSPLARALEEESADPLGAPRSLVQGNQFEAFGPHARGVRYPDRRALWIQRRGATELYPFAGVRQGVRYENNVSPDGLDHFASHLSLSLLRTLSDPERLRLLRAWGVDWLVLDRPLQGAEAQARPVATVRQFSAQSTLYRLVGSAPAALVVGTVHPAADVGEVRDAMLAPGFDPRRQAVVLGDLRLDGPPGRVLSYREAPSLADPSIRLEIESEGRALLVLSRAFQPGYRVRVSGQEVPISIANLSRLAALVPPGRHLVEIDLERGAARWWWWIMLLAWIAVGAAGLAPYRPRRPGGQPLDARGESALAAALAAAAERSEREIERESESGRGESASAEGAGTR